MEQNNGAIQERVQLEGLYNSDLTQALGLPRSNPSLHLHPCECTMAFLLPRLLRLGIHHDLADEW